MTNPESLSQGTKRKRDEPETPQWGSVTRILVGRGEEPFIVHAHILRKIPFFRACLDADMKEKHENIVRMPEDNAITFAGIVHWVYHNELPFNIHQIREDEIEDQIEAPLGRVFKLKLLQVFDLYFLARKLMVEDLQNHIVDVVRELTRETDLSEGFFEAFIDDTDTRDPMRRMLLEDLSNNVSEAGWPEWKMDPIYRDFALKRPEYMGLVAEALATFPIPTCPYNSESPCDWHEHMNTPDCETSV